MSHDLRSAGSDLPVAELVTIRTFLNKIDAEVARSALEAVDIPAMIRADDAGGLEPGLWMGRVRLQVRAEDADRAREVLGPDDAN